MDNPYAFPSEATYIKDRGMTLRDYFAAAALTGLLSYVSRDDWEDGKFNKQVAEKQYVGTAYELADAMLAERAKGGAA